MTAARIATISRGRVDLEEIFRASEGHVFVYFLRVVGDRDLAADLAQDTLVRALENIGRFRGESSFRTWLMAIARARLADHFRRKRPEALEEPPEQTVHDRHDLRLGVEETLRELPTTYREALVLCDVLGFEPTEAAAVTGLTDNAFRVRLHRARKRFRELHGDG